METYFKTIGFEVESLRGLKRSTNEKVQKDDVGLMLQCPQTIYETLDHFTSGYNDERSGSVCIN